MQSAKRKVQNLRCHCEGIYARGNLLQKPIVILSGVLKARSRRIRNSYRLTGGAVLRTAGERILRFAQNDIRGRSLTAPDKIYRCKTLSLISWVLP